MATFNSAFRPLYERWRADIKVFAREGMNFPYTWQQEQLLDIVQLESHLAPGKRKKRIAVRSGQGPGKTAVSAIVANWRCIKYEDALTIVTAPSMRQCKQWIDENARLLKMAHPFIKRFFKPFGTKIEVNGSKIWGIRTATATRPENLQGIHEKHLTFIGDEASGIAPSIIETIKGTLSNPDALFLMIGNPNTSSCAFHDCFTTHRDSWHTLAWNAEDTARDYPHLVSPDRNRQLAREYGRDSDVYRVRVLGEFPYGDPNTIMALRDIMACTRTSKSGCVTIVDMMKVNHAIGIDFARFGSDESVVIRRSGLAVVDFRTFNKREPIEVVDYAFLQQYEAGWSNNECWYIPDAGGMGQGVLNSFHESGKNVLEYHTQSVAFDTSMFADMASEAWFCLRNLVKEHIVHLPDDPRLIKQLSTRQYYMDRQGKIKIESKDEWRKRLEISESPDRADAMVMAFYPHVGEVGGVVRPGGSSRQVGMHLRRNR